MRRLLPLVLVLAGWIPAIAADAAPSPECSGNQIHLSLYSEGTGGGWWISHYEVSSLLPCELHGSFAARGFSHDGHLLFGHVDHGNSQAVVAPRHPVYFTMTSQDWNPETGRPCPVAARIVFRPPSHHGHETLERQNLTACPTNPPPLMSDFTTDRPPN